MAATAALGREKGLQHEATAASGVSWARKWEYCWATQDATRHLPHVARSMRSRTSQLATVNRRFQLDSIVERLAWAAVHTDAAYRLVVSDA